MKIVANKARILNNCYDMTLQDMGLLWMIAFLVDEHGEFELSYEDLQEKFNYKNKAALDKATKTLIEYHWIEKISKNQYKTECFRVK